MHSQNIQIPAQRMKEMKESKMKLKDCAFQHISIMLYTCILQQIHFEFEARSSLISMGIERPICPTIYRAMPFRIPIRNSTQFRPIVIAAARLRLLL